MVAVDVSNQRKERNGFVQFIWDIDPVLIRIGGMLEIRYYGLIFSLVLVGSYFLFWWWQPYFFLC